MSVTNSLPAANSHFISLETAIDMTTKYRNEHEIILAPEYRNQGVLPLSETFSRAALDAILAQNDCEGVRIYYGMDGDGKVHAILVGVTANNRDLLKDNSLSKGPGGDIIVELAQRCPDLCPPDSPLNN